MKEYVEKIVPANDVSFLSRSNFFAGSYYLEIELFYQSSRGTVHLYETELNLQELVSIFIGM